MATKVLTRDARRHAIHDRVEVAARAHRFCIEANDLRSRIRDETKRLPTIERVMLVSQLRERLRHVQEEYSRAKCLSDRLTSEIGD
jgi:hypothetical protein